MNKNYDWFDVLISNPDLSVQDFSIAGINDTNTTLKDSNYYKDLDVVKEKFIDPETQKFDSKAYEQYYDSVARVYDNYMQSIFNKRAIDKDYSYQELKNMMKLDGSVFLERVPNPTKEKKGIEGVFTTTKGTLSMREAAQNSRVYDYYLDIGACEFNPDYDLVPKYKDNISDILYNYDVEGKKLYISKDIDYDKVLIFDLSGKCIYNNIFSDSYNVYLSRGYYILNLLKDKNIVNSFKLLIY